MGVIGKVGGRFVAPSWVGHGTGCSRKMSGPSAKNMDCEDKSMINNIAS